MASLGKVWNPLTISVLFVSVILTNGLSYGSSAAVSILNSASNATDNNNTIATSISTTTTVVPLQQVSNVTLASNDSSSQDTNSLFTSNDTSSSVGNADNSTSGSSTSQVASDNSTDSVSPTENAPNGTVTSFPESLAAVDPNTNIDVDPMSGVSTPANLSSETPTTTTGTTLQTPTETPAAQIVVKNPYEAIRAPRPVPLLPLTPQQHQRLMNPWLFYGSDYFPYLLWLSSQQANQQGTANNPVNNIAPLYMMDVDMWPLLLAQQRSQQQPQRSQQNLVSQQQQTQINSNQTQPVPNQNHYNPQTNLARNNLASWYFLNEMYF